MTTNHAHTPSIRHIRWAYRNFYGTQEAGKEFDRGITDHEITVRIRLLDDLLEIAQKHDGHVPEEQLRFLKEFGQTALEAPHD